jgi:deazaflavin-dependent oxidoreductase (nitroreductase family)
MTSRRGLATFNRRYANRIFGPVLTRMPGFGAVQHRGRTSRKAYVTPVKYFRHGNAYIIALPYGAESDWVRNVIAANGCQLRTRGRTVFLRAPHVYLDDGHTGVPRPIAAVLRRLGVQEFLSLDPDPEPVAR